MDWPNPPTTVGTYNVEFSFIDSGANWRTYSTRLTVLPPAQRKFESSDQVTVYVQIPGGTLTLYRRSTVHLWSSGQTDYQQRDRPLLVVEGIDADNKNSAATYLALGSNTRGGTQDALFPLSLGNGADVGILDFADGSRDMVYNAQVVKGAVRFFRGWRSRPDVGFGVAGVSMGGVVARRALAEMEDEQSRGLESPHGVAHFVSLDAPQRGALVDRNLQDDIKELSRINSNIDVPAALRSEAGMQLLIYAPFDTATPTRHQSFFQSLRAPRHVDGVGQPPRSQRLHLRVALPPRHHGGLRFGWGRTLAHRVNIAAENRRRRHHPQPRHAVRVVRRPGWPDVHPQHFRKRVA